MENILVKNTYDLPITGEPSKNISTCLDVKQLSVSPAGISMIKPKLLVREGDKVKLGQPLFYDKQDDRIKFVAPGAGTVSEVRFGERRRIEAVVIDLDSKEEAEAVKVSSDSREGVVQTLLDGGLWGFFTEYPFMRIPNPDVQPPAIYVTLDYDEPFMPASDVYLDGRLDDLKAGLDILRKLAPQVHVGVSSSNELALDGIATHRIQGGYPANNPGVFLYHNKKSADENSSWGIRGLDVLLIADLFKNGVYPTERIAVVAGDLADNPSHVRTREGVLFSDLAKVPSEPTRYIAGGVLTGRNAGEAGSLSYHEYALHLIREGKEQEMLTFFRPGFDKPTYSRTYFSALLRNVRQKMTTGLNGGDRSCISCGECPSVCPVDLLPQFAMKSLLAGDIEDAIGNGFLDCVDCGLCTYVCPSKIDLDGVFRQAREQLAKEA